MGSSFQILSVFGVSVVNDLCFWQTNGINRYRTYKWLNGVYEWFWHNREMVALWEGFYTRRKWSPVRVSLPPVCCWGYKKFVRCGSRVTFWNHQLFKTFLQEMHFRRTCLLVEYEDANRALDKAKPQKKSSVRRFISSLFSYSRCVWSVVRTCNLCKKRYW